jgi:nitrile hydratase accessory protein
LNPHDQPGDIAAQILDTIPGLDDENPLFRAPWQTRIFALVVTLVEEGHFPWTAFQTRLADLITQSEQIEFADSADRIESRYFDCWLQAAEETFTDQRLLEDCDVDQKIGALRQTIAEIRAVQTNLSQTSENN